MSATDKADEAGRRADDSTTLDHAVRVGLVSYGVVHLLIAWLAFQLATGDGGGGTASKSGALHQIVSQPFGRVLMWVVGFGFVALVVWQLIEAVLGHRGEDGATRVGKRLVSATKSVIYATLGFSAFKVAAGAGSGGKSADSMTASLMSLPLGAVLVGLVGVVVVGYGIANMYYGLSEGFTEHLSGRGTDGDSGSLVLTLAKVGYAVRGVAFVVVGGLFVWAAYTHDPKKSGGLDVALRTVLEQPYGGPLLLAIAAGIGCFGIYCFAWARHLDR